MSSDPVRTALLHARTRGVPYVHRVGALVVLVLHGEGNPITGEQRGVVCTRMCASAGIAKAVEARALDDLDQFPESRDPLRVSAMYAEAAYRHAMRRSGRLWWRAA